MQFILYTTLGCHLCDQAKAVIAQVLASTSYTIEEIDIAASEQLTAQYGIRIPVVAMAARDRAELGWPFDELQFRQWLDGR